MSAPFHKAWVVANPIAGRGRAQTAARALSEGLARIGVANEVRFTQAKGDARRFLGELDPDVDLVVAVGGDGTVNEVLDGMAQRRVPVAILPMGTANVMSLDLALPRNVEGALSMIAAGRTNALDTARVNQDHLSFLVVGIGFDAMVVHELEARRSGPITKLSWIAPALKSWSAYRPPALSVEVDGVRQAGTFGMVLVSNIVHYAGFEVLSREYAIDDGRFEVYLFEGGSRTALVGYALRAMVLGLPGAGCRRIPARHVVVSSDIPVPVHIDGEARGVTPVEFDVNTVPHSLVVPLEWAGRTDRGASGADSAR